MGEQDLTPVTNRRPSGRLRQPRDSDGYHRFMERGLWPLLTILATVAYGRVQHYQTTSDAEKKVAGVEKKVDEKTAEVSKEATATTRRAWRGLAQPTNKLQDRVQACEERLVAVEKTQKAQSAVISAWEKDFVIEGKPSVRKIDAGLIKAVRENAAKNSKELEARRAKPLPVLKPIPLEIPKEVARPAPPTLPPALPSSPTPAPILVDAAVPKS